MTSWTPLDDYGNHLSAVFETIDRGSITVNRSLNDIMEFGHTIEVHPDGTVSDSSEYGPESVYQELDADGQCINDDVHDLPAGWALLTGYTGQYGYNGPVMHPSEYIGGGMARDILTTPGHYVAVMVDGLGPEESDDDNNIGWAVAYRESE